MSDQLTAAQEQEIREVVARPGPYSVVTFTRKEIRGLLTELDALRDECAKATALAVNRGHDLDECRRQLAEREREIAVDDQLLAERNQLLDLFECPVHGKQCVSHAIQEVQRLRRADSLRQGIEAVRILINDSRGVVGLHHNGDEAPWEELLAGGRFEEWLRDFSAAEAALRGEQGQQHPSTTDVLARLLTAAEHPDWMQVVLNQGPPCFHLEDDGHFCLRAERWAGHGDGKDAIHPFTSLASQLRSLVPTSPSTRKSE